MLKGKVLAMAAAVAIGLAGAAQAIDDDGLYSIRGAGTVRCSVYLNFSPADKLSAETWWAGYITAANRFTKDTYSLMGNVTVAQVNETLARLCRENPDKLFAEIVNQAMEDMYPQRQRRSPSR